LYKIEIKGLFSDDFAPLAIQIIEEDKQQYKNHNRDYFDNPANEIQRALGELENNRQWQQHWQSFVETMVFARVKPGYNSALQNVLNKSELVLLALQR
jgi:hypothetical protein